MTNPSFNEDITGGDPSGTNIELGTEQTSDKFSITEQIINKTDEATHGTTSRNNEYSGSFFRLFDLENDEKFKKIRAAQASAYFDPEAIELLGQLSQRSAFTFDVLSTIIDTPQKWIKLAILMRAFLIEPLDNGVRITKEGIEAIENITRFMAIYKSRES